LKACSNPRALTQRNGLALGDHLAQSLKCAHCSIFDLTAWNFLKGTMLEPMDAVDDDLADVELMEPIQEKKMI
jgi:hypothetical protein